MTESGPESARTARSWDTYWHGTGDAGAYAAGGAAHPGVRSFWHSFFRAVKQEFDSPGLIDIASGNGAVIESIVEIWGEPYPDITALDASAAAVRNVCSRFPGVHGVVADARSIPLESGTFDIVTSQFGVEYAGLAAVDEAARLVAKGGRLALLLHSKAGMIHHECAQSLDAISRLQQSAFIPLASKMFGAAFEACRGADRAPYEAAAKQLAPAVRTLESIIQQYGEHVASDTIARLYQDVGRIHREVQHYDPGEVLGWLQRMEAELVDYAGRMSSMCDCAIDEPSFERVCKGLESRGHSLLRAEPMMPGDGSLPLAWILVAAR